MTTPTQAPTPPVPPTAQTVVPAPPASTQGLLATLRDIRAAGGAQPGSTVTITLKGGETFAAKVTR